MVVVICASFGEVAPKEDHCGVGGPLYHEVRDPEERDGVPRASL